MLENSHEKKKLLDDTQALRWLCLTRNTRCVRLLLQHGVDVNDVSNTFQQSVLFTACSLGHLGLVKMLLHYKANVDLVYRSDDATPLYSACKNGDLDIVRILLDHGANVNHSISGPPNTPVGIACETANTALLKLLLLFKPTLSNVFGTFSAFELTLSLKNLSERKSVLQCLFENCPASEITAHDDSLLLHVTLQEDLESVKLFLHHGADPDVMTTHEEICAMDVVYIQNYCKMGALFATFGAKLDKYVSYNLLTPQTEYTSTQKWIQDSNGWTALHHACFGNFPCRVRQLLKQGDKEDVRAGRCSVTPLELSSVDETSEVYFLMQQSMLPWTLHTQGLFPKHHNMFALWILLLCHRLQKVTLPSKKRRKLSVAIPKDIWLLILEFLVPRRYEGGEELSRFFFKP
jgi:ankyrin repeat protein